MSVCKNFYKIPKSVRSIANKNWPHNFSYIETLSRLLIWRNFSMVFCFTYSIGMSIFSQFTVNILYNCLFPIEFHSFYLFSIFLYRVISLLDMVLQPWLGSNFISFVNLVKRLRCVAILLILNAFIKWVYRFDLQIFF